MVDNNLDSRMQSRRKSDCGFESGGESVKLKRHPDCLPHELLYNLNAKLLIDSGLEDQAGVFWYLDKNRQAVGKRLRDLLQIVKLKATKLVKQTSLEFEKLRCRLKIAGALVNLARSRANKNNKSDSYMASFSRAINARLDESSEKLEDDEERMYTFF